MPNVGDVLQGKLDAYKLEEVLVDGRFGRTYKAVRTRDDEDVILKTLTLDRPADWSVMEVFERESDRLRQLSHPHIAPYLDAVVLQQTDQGAELGLVQTFITTPTVKRWGAGRGVVDLDACLGWMERTLEALVYLHEQSTPVIHGDLDWGNILLGDDGSVKLVDFATVRQEILSSSTLASGMARGTLDFAPMEHLFGKLYPSSDLYALAMTVLAVIHGSHPSEFPTQGMSPNIREILPYNSDDAITSLFKQLTEADPHHRLQSARIALERLRALRHDDPSYDFVPSKAADNTPLARAAGTSEATPEQRAQRDAIALSLMKSVGELHGLIDEGEAWERAPGLERERVHAFGIDRHGTHMVVAHKHDASVLSGQELEVRGEVDFEELARRIAVSADGKRIAILTGFEDLLFFDVNVSVWQRYHVVVEGMWPGNSQLTFSPSGDRVAISDDDQVNVYRWDDSELLARWDVDGQFGLEFSPDGKLIFAVGEQVTTLIDGDELHKLDIDGIAFSPDGTHVTTTHNDMVTMGEFGQLSPQITFRTPDTQLKVEQSFGARLHMVRYSPNQEHVFVGSAQGFWRLVDTRRLSVMPFADPRCDDQNQTKIFEVGFSPDSSRLLLHASLTTDVFHEQKMGAVFSWKLPQGQFLGAMLMLDYELSVISAQGFYGEVKELRSSGFSSDEWERTELAGPLYQGRDVEHVLSAQERACLREFHLRREHLKRIGALAGMELELERAMGALANLSHVALEVFRRADALAKSEGTFGYGTSTRGLAALLEDAAFNLDSDHSREELAQMHERLLKDPGLDDAQAGPKGDYARISAQTASGYERSQSEAPAVSGYERSQHDAQAHASHAHGAQHSATPYVSADQMPELPPRSMPPAVKHREPRPMPASTTSSASTSSAMAADAEELPEQGFNLMAAALSAGLAYAIVFAGVYFMGLHLAHGTTFWGMLLGVAPSLGALLYFLIFKPMLRS